MDIKVQKDRLEQELRFLKESFEAEVISKEEFEKGKERIERKLNELEYMHKSDVESKIEDEKKEAKTQEAEEAKAEPKDEAEPKKQEEPLEHEERHKPHEPRHSGNEKSSSGFWKYAAIILVLVVAALLAFNYFKPDNANTAAYFCSSDADCIAEGKAGKCTLPGSSSSKCEFTNLKSVKVIVLTDSQNCISCDTSRVLSILNEWVGPINASEVPYSTQRGKELAQKYNANVLPLFIIDAEAKERPSFLQFQRSFSQVDDAYVLSDRVAGASVYINRQEIKGKLDLFAREGDNASRKAEENLQEFLSNFEAIFEKHSSTSALARELGLNTFPAFLVNNMAGFTGVHTAESIKQNYCKLNDDENCDKTLSTSLR